MAVLGITARWTTPERSHAQGKVFKRNAIVDDSLIEVSNIGGDGLLGWYGHVVDGEAEAENAAWDAPGVVDVVDRLTVVP